MMSAKDLLDSLGKRFPVVQDPVFWTRLLVISVTATLVTFVARKVYSWLNGRSCIVCKQAGVYKDPIDNFQEIWKKEGDGKLYYALYWNWRSIQKGFDIETLEVLEYESLCEEAGVRKGGDLEKRIQLELRNGPQNEICFFLALPPFQHFRSSWSALFIDSATMTPLISRFSTDWHNDERLTPGIISCTSFANWISQDSVRDSKIPKVHPNYRESFLFNKSVRFGDQGCASWEYKSTDMGAHSFKEALKLKAGRLLPHHTQDDIDEFNSWLFGNGTNSAIMLACHNLCTMTGVKLTATMLSAVVDQASDIANCATNYFLGHHTYPLLGSLSVSLIVVPLLLHWALLYTLEEAALRDLPFSLTGMDIIAAYCKSLLHGVNMPGLFWCAFFEGTLESPLQAQLTLYNLMIGLMSQSTLAFSSLLISFCMASRSIHALDQFGLFPAKTLQDVMCRLVDRLAEIVSRVVSVVTFLAVMRPNIPLNSSYPHTLILFLLADIPLTIVAVLPWTQNHRRAMRAILVAVSLVVRPPVLVQEIMKIRVALMCIRLFELILMSGIAFKYAHREIPGWTLWVLSTCNLLILCSAVAEARSVCFAYSEHEALAGASRNEQLKGALEDFNLILSDLFLNSGADPNVEFDLRLRLGEARPVTPGAGDAAEVSVACPAIFWAITMDQPNLARLLVQHKADVNHRITLVYDEEYLDAALGMCDMRAHNEEEHTPLSYAVLKGSLRMVNLLLQLGGEPNASLHFCSDVSHAPTDTCDKTPLFYAEKKGKDIQDKLQAALIGQGCV